METTTRTPEARALPPYVVARLLTTDDAGRPAQLLTDKDGGSPLRCCLRLSRPGERVALVAYAPLRRWAAEAGVDPGAYDETGPVLVHAEPCAGFAGPDLPVELLGSPRVLRAYGYDGRIRSAEVVPSAGDLAATAAALLADPGVAVVHARAVAYGCFTFEVVRAPVTSGATRR